MSRLEKFKEEEARQAPVNLHYAYFDISSYPKIRPKLHEALTVKHLGRIYIALYNRYYPDSVRNFLLLCKGLIPEYDYRPVHESPVENEVEAFQRPEAKKTNYWYKNSIIHRIIPGFAFQGGDVTNFDGTGGASVFRDYEHGPFPKEQNHATLLFRVLRYRANKRMEAKCQMELERNQIEAIKLRKRLKQSKWKEYKACVQFLNYLNAHLDSLPSNIYATGLAVAQQLDPDLEPTVHGLQKNLQKVMRLGPQETDHLSAEEYFDSIRLRNPPRIVKAIAQQGIPVVTYEELSLSPDPWSDETIEPIPKKLPIPIPRFVDPEDYTRFDLTLDFPEDVFGNVHDSDIPFTLSGDVDLNSFRALHHAPSTEKIARDGNKLASVSILDPFKLTTWSKQPVPPIVDQTTVPAATVTHQETTSPGPVEDEYPPEYYLYRDKDGHDPSAVPTNLETASHSISDDETRGAANDSDGDTLHDHDDLFSIRDPSSDPMYQLPHYFGDIYNEELYQPADIPDDDDDGFDGGDDDGDRDGENNNDTDNEFHTTVSKTPDYGSMNQQIDNTQYLPTPLTTAAITSTSSGEYDLGLSEDSLATLSKNKALKSSTFLPSPSTATTTAATSLMGKNAGASTSTSISLQDLESPYLDSLIGITAALEKEGQDGGEGWSIIYDGPSSITFPYPVINRHTHSDAHRVDDVLSHDVLGDDRYVKETYKRITSPINDRGLVIRNEVEYRLKKLQYSCEALQRSIGDIRCENASLLDINHTYRYGRRGQLGLSNNGKGVSSQFFITLGDTSSSIDHNVHPLIGEVFTDHSFETLRLIENMALEDESTFENIFISQCGIVPPDEAEYFRTIHNDSPFYVSKPSLVYKVPGGKYDDPFNPFNVFDYVAERHHREYSNTASYVPVRTYNDLLSPLVMYQGMSVDRYKATLDSLDELEHNEYFTQDIIEAKYPGRIHYKLHAKQDPYYLKDPYHSAPNKYWPVYMVGNVIDPVSARRTHKRECKLLLRNIGEAVVSNPRGTNPAQTVHSVQFPLLPQMYANIGYGSSNGDVDSKSHKVYHTEAIIKSISAFSDAYKKKQLEPLTEAERVNIYNEMYNNLVDYSNEISQEDKDNLYYHHGTVHLMPYEWVDATSCVYEFQRVTYGLQNNRYTRVTRTPASVIVTNVYFPLNPYDPVTSKTVTIPLHQAADELVEPLQRFVYTEFNRIFEESTKKAEQAMLRNKHSLPGDLSRKVNGLTITFNKTDGNNRDVHTVRRDTPASISELPITYTKGKKQHIVPPSVQEFVFVDGELVPR